MELTLLQFRIKFIEFPTYCRYLFSILIDKICNTNKENIFLTWRRVDCWLVLLAKVFSTAFEIIKRLEFKQFETEIAGVRTCYLQLHFKCLIKHLDFSSLVKLMPLEVQVAWNHIGNVTRLLQLFLSAYGLQDTVVREAKTRMS